MQTTTKKLSDTKVQLQLSATPEALQQTKNQVVKRLGRNMKVPGFREGKAPQHLLEKQLNPTTLHAEVLDDVINQLYTEAIRAERIRVVEKPQVNITKFVPFTTLEFTAEVEAVGAIKLPDYKKMKLEKKSPKIVAKDVEEVLAQLRTREAEKKDVQRAAKQGDQVWIDFVGIDAKTKEAITGADGKDYPLVLGSNTFIPGFEPQLVGLKVNDEKTFDITFPKDYSAKALQSRKVSFTVTVKKVQEITEPKLDDAFAAKIGPFKTVAELKADIKKQLTAEAERKATDEFETTLIRNIAAETEVAIPKVLIDDQIDQIEREERQNVTYRGQTWEQHLESEGVTAEEHREQKRTQAEEQIKMGLVLSEIADKEQIVVTPEELDIRLQLLKGQYPDPQMQTELNKPEARRDLLNRLLTEKTLTKLHTYLDKPAVTEK